MTIISYDVNGDLNWIKDYLTFVLLITINVLRCRNQWQVKLRKMMKLCRCVCVHLFFFFALKISTLSSHRIMSSKIYIKVNSRQC